MIPGLTRREKRFLAPIVLGSSVLFVGGLWFSYSALIPAALNFFITYGQDVVEQAWSIDRYFEFVLLLMFSHWASVSDSCRAGASGLFGDCLVSDDASRVEICAARGSGLGGCDHAFY